MTARSPFVGLLLVLRALESIGWTWGGTWRSLEDYQHFSQNGR